MQEDTVGPLKAQVGKWLNQGWEWMIADLASHLLIGLLSILVLFISQSLLYGPVAAVSAWFCLQTARDGRCNLGTFSNVARFLLSALLSGLLIVIFSLVGLAFLIVPGLVIFSMYLFTFHFIVDQELDFWTAMESSRQIVARDYFGFTVFTVLLVGLNLLGLAFFGIGSVFTLSVSFLAITAAYEECSGTAIEVAQAPPTVAPVRID